MNAWIESTQRYMKDPKVRLALGEHALQMCRLIRMAGPGGSLSDAEIAPEKFFGAAEEARAIIETLSALPETAYAILREVRFRMFVDAAIAERLDDVANISHHFQRKMQEAYEGLSPGDQQEVQRWVEAAWLKETHYCSGMPIAHLDTDGGGGDAPYCIPDKGTQEASVASPPGGSAPDRRGAP